MRRPGVLLVPLLLSCAVERRTPMVPAELVLRHGAIWTGAPSRPWIEALAVREGHIVYAGDDGGILRYIGSATRVIDLGGRMAMPGFHDTHAHPLSGGLELGECNLYDARTSAEAEGLIHAYAQGHRELAWVKGNGWQLPLFPAGNPRKEMLDRAVPDRPALFYAADGHSAWVNSRALSLAGITKETADPADGRIERDPATGEPSGTLRESAIDLVAEKLPPYSAEQRVGAVRRALAEANRFGITAITDADAGPEYLAAYADLDHRGELTARVTAAIHTEGNAPLETELARLRDLRTKYRVGNRLAVNTVKLYADGVIEARTAALLEPYIDGHGARGPLNYEPDDFTARITAFDRDGFQIHVHAIGDRAIRVTLDALERARDVNGPRDARPIIAHLELFNPADIPRFRELGVIASFQPYWALPDDYITRLTQPALGPARSRWLYPIASVMNSGAVVVGGSDWTVSSLNPLDAIQVALTRQEPEHPDGPVLVAEERVDLPRMLAAYTINGAYAERLERESGSLEQGKAADVIVLDRNLFTLPANRIHEAKVLLTLLDGQPVYRDTTFVKD